MELLKTQNSTHERQKKKKLRKENSCYSYFNSRKSIQHHGIKH